MNTSFFLRKNPSSSIAEQFCSNGAASYYKDPNWSYQPSHREAAKQSYNPAD
jgi:hypothetical protein